MQTYTHTTRLYVYIGRHQAANVGLLLLHAINTMHKHLHPRIHAHLYQNMNMYLHTCKLIFSHMQTYIYLYTYIYMYQVADVGLQLLHAINHMHKVQI